jgi:hypothetical protein
MDNDTLARRLIEEQRDAQQRIARLETQEQSPVRVLTATATLDFPSIGSHGTADLFMSVPFATVGDGVVITPPDGFDAGLIVHGWVSSNYTVTVRVTNIKGTAIDAASGVFRAVVFKSG